MYVNLFNKAHINIVILSVQFRVIALFIRCHKIWFVRCILLTMDPLPSCLQSRLPASECVDVDPNLLRGFPCHLTQLRTRNR